MKEKTHPGNKEISLYAGEQTSEVVFWTKLYEIDPFGALPNTSDLISMVKQGTSVKGANTDYSHMLSTWFLRKDVLLKEAREFSSLSEKYKWHVANADSLHDLYNLDPVLPEFCAELFEDVIVPASMYGGNDYYVYHRPYVDKRGRLSDHQFTSDSMFHWQKHLHYGFIPLHQDTFINTEEVDIQRKRFDWIGFTQIERAMAEELQKESALRMHRFLYLLVAAKLTKRSLKVAMPAIGMLEHNMMHYEREKFELISLIRNRLDKEERGLPAELWSLILSFVPTLPYIPNNVLRFFYESATTLTNPDNRLSGFYKGYAVYQSGDGIYSVNTVMASDLEDSLSALTTLDAPETAEKQFTEQKSESLSSL